MESILYDLLLCWVRVRVGVCVSLTSCVKIGLKSVYMKYLLRGGKSSMASDYSKNESSM